MASHENAAVAGHAGGEADGVRRRDFIHVASGGYLGVGAVMAAWPFVDQMNPSADVLAMAKTDVDLAPIAEGQTIKIMHQGKPVFVRNRTKREIEDARKVDLAELRDPQTDAERVQAGHEQWLITLAVCTHLGCVPLGAAQGEPRGDYNGYFCPCHGSHYDTSARIRKGPAPTNLEVPAYTFKTPTAVVIG